MLSAIDPHVFDAVAMTAFMRCWNDAKPELTPKLLGTEMAMGFKVITRAIQSSALLAVCRSWDTANDTRSFPKLADLLGEDAVIRLIAEDRHQDLEALLADIEGFKQSETLMALRVSRAEGFAHNIGEARARQAMGDAARPAAYGELYEATSLCKDLLERCYLLLHGYESRIREWEIDHSRILTNMIADIQNYNA